MVFKTPYNYDHTVVVNLRLDPVSMTVPDETLSIKEILYRFTNGISPLAGRELPYDKEGVTIDDDVNPMNDPDMSLADIHARMNYHYQRYTELVEEDKKRMEAAKAFVPDPVTPVSQE